MKLAGFGLGSDYVTANARRRWRGRAGSDRPAHIKCDYRLFIVRVLMTAGIILYCYFICIPFIMR